MSPFQKGNLQNWETALEPRGDLINVTYGWKKGNLPRYTARSEFHRQLVMRRMLTELVRRDHVIVAGARAPALRTMADRLVRMCRNGDTSSRQHVAYVLQDPLMVDKAFDEYPRRFKDHHHGSFTMVTKLRSVRAQNFSPLYFVEFKNRDLSDCHKGEDYTRGPDRFFLPPKITETERGVIRPPHIQMAFDRWASKFKTEEFHLWWKMRHAKMRFWGFRNVPHPSDVEPLWNEKDEEEWHGEMLAGSGDAAAYDLDEASEIAEAESTSTFETK
jgi:ribosomal protein L17